MRILQYYNMTEMLWSDETERLLRLCGTDELEIGVSASDFDRLTALARCMPSLTGHPLAARVQALLKQCFSITKPLNVDTVGEIWRETAGQLLNNPLERSSFVLEASVAEPLPTPTELTEKMRQSDAFSALLFARTKAKSLDGWMREIESVLRDVLRNGCKTLFFGLPEAFEDRKPSIYHVDMTLHNGVRAKHDLDLLYAQLARCLSQICQAHDLTLLLRIEAAPGEALSLLSRVEREVGLPRLVWSTPRIDTRNEMLNFSAESHKNPIFAAISSSDYPSPAAFRSALADWATVYPIGRLIEIEE